MPEDRIFGVFDGVSSAHWDADFTKERWLHFYRTTGNIRAATELIFDEAMDSVDTDQILHSTTLLICQVRGETLRILNFGDSEAYAWNTMGILRLNTPQTPYHTQIEPLLKEEYQLPFEKLPQDPDEFNDLFMERGPSDELQRKIHSCLGLDQSTIPKLLIFFLLANVIKIAPDSSIGIKIRNQHSEFGWSALLLSFFCTRLMNSLIALPSSTGAINHLTDQEFDMTDKDGILICTDGLTKVIKPPLIHRYMTNFSSQEAATLMLSKSVTKIHETSDHKDDVATVIMKKDRSGILMAA